MGVTVTSIGTDRQRKKARKTAEKKGYAMKVGNTKKADRLGKKQDRQTKRMSKYTRSHELSTGKITVTKNNKVK
jgi:hypothetical protein